MMSVRDRDRNNLCKIALKWKLVDVTYDPVDKINESSEEREQKKPCRNFFVNKSEEIDGGRR